MYHATNALVPSLQARASERVLFYFIVECNINIETMVATAAFYKQLIFYKPKLFWKYTNIFPDQSCVTWKEPGTQHQMKLKNLLTRIVTTLMPQVGRNLLTRSTSLATREIELFAVASIYPSIRFGQLSFHLSQPHKTDTWL